MSLEEQKGLSDLILKEKKDNLKEEIIKEFRKKFPTLYDEITSSVITDYFICKKIDQVRQETKKEYQQKLRDLNKRLNKQCEDKIKEIIK